MGSAMTFALACAPERKFAAFGGAVALTLFERPCQTTPPPDHLLTGPRTRWSFPRRAPGGETSLPAVPVAMQEWADHNGCTQDATDEGAMRPAGNGRRSANADVEYYWRGGGHTWSGVSPFIADA